MIIPKEVKQKPVEYLILLVGLTTGLFLYLVLLRASSSIFLLTILKPGGGLFMVLVLFIFVGVCTIITKEVIYNYRSLSNIY
jgi:hypothetical protein